MELNKLNSMYQNSGIRIYQAVERTILPALKDKKIASFLMLMLFLTGEASANTPGDDLGVSKVTSGVGKLFKLVHVLVIAGMVVFAGKTALEGFRGEQGAWQKFLGICAVGALWTWGVPALVATMGKQDTITIAP